MPHSKANSSASNADCKVPNKQPPLHNKISSPDGSKAVMASPPAEAPFRLLAPSTESLMLLWFALAAQTASQLGRDQSSCISVPVYLYKKAGQGCCAQTCASASAPM